MIMANSTAARVCSDCGRSIPPLAHYIRRAGESVCVECVTKGANEVLADKGYAPAGYAQAPLPFAVDYATRDEVVYQRVRQGIDFEFTFDAELRPREVYVTRLSATSTLIRQTDPQTNTDRFYVVNVAQVWYVLSSSPHRLECRFCRGVIPVSTTFAADPLHPTSLWPEHVGHIACCLTAELQNGVTSWPSAGCINPLNSPAAAPAEDRHAGCDHALQAAD